jgi:hypothetical protein
MRLIAPAISCLACLLVTHQARSEVIGNPDALGNTDAIDNWDNVGQVNGASGIYIGNGWVLTVAHLGTPSGILFDFSPTPYLSDPTMHPGGNYPS